MSPQLMKAKYNGGQPRREVATTAYTAKKPPKRKTNVLRQLLKERDSRQIKTQAR